MVFNRIREYLSGSKPSQNNIPKVVCYYSSGGKMTRRKKEESSTKSITNSVGWALGFNPKLISVSFTSNMSKSTINRLFNGYEIFDPKGKIIKKSKAYIRQVGDGLYRLKVSPLLPTPVMERILEEVRSLLKLKFEDFLPIHPNWVFEKDSINLLIKGEGKSFLDVFGKRRDIFYRAGKDIWKPAIGSPRRLKLKIITTPESHDDGNFWIRGEKETSSLARGVVRDGNSYILLKGRMVTINKLPDGSDWPQGYDGVCSHHNIKWVLSTPPETIELDVLEVQDENHSSKEKYSLSILTMLMAVMPVAWSNRFLRAFRKNAENAITLLQNFPSNINKLLESNTSNLYDWISNSQVIKMGHGYGTENDIEEYLTSKLMTIRSIKIPGEWASIITWSNVPRGTIFAASDVAEKVLSLYGSNATLLRYPITSHQSFFTANVVESIGLPKGFIAINDKDAKYLGADGDDHGLLVAPAYSGFCTGEEPVAARNLEKLDLGSLSLGQLLFSGAKAQNLIGFAFNGMAASVALKKPELTRDLGELLDTLAQAVKKPYVYNEDLITEALDLEVSAFAHPIAAIAMKRDIPTALYSLWNIVFPSTIKQGKAPVIVQSAVISDVYRKAVRTIPESGRLSDLTYALDWHRDFLIDLDCSDATEDMVAGTYLAVAEHIRCLVDSPMKTQLLRVLLGELIQVGVNVHRNMYSPLFD